MGNLQKRFSELVVHAGEPVQTLPDIRPGELRCAEADLYVGWSDDLGGQTQREECTEARTVLAVVGSSRSAGKGQEPSPAVFICFNYSPHAESIQLQLNLSTPMIEPPPAQ